MRPDRPARFLGPNLVLVGLCWLCPGPMVADAGPPRDPFAGLDLPDDWEARFWGNPDAQAFLKLEPRALARLVPTQAGLRFCRCPACDAPEVDDPLGWSIRKPDVVTCKRCGASFPNDKVPAPVDKKVPEEAVEVVPGVVHRYPYHAVEPDRQRQPEERLYLAARRDHEAREYLSKAALYAAVRFRDQPPAAKDPALARAAAVLVLRFAQAYPLYALHLDQPGQAKFFEPARQPPPYRRGYATAKWDWSGSLDVPINLALAYAIVRETPALAEAGKILGDASPARTIEADLFRASAAFGRDQPREANEQALQVIRGLLAVGRLLGDDDLIALARARLGEFGEQGFYFDGLWRAGDTPTHARVVGMLDGWIGRLLPGTEPGSAAGGPPRPGRPAREPIPMLGLARSAGSAVLADARIPEIRQAAWPSPAPVAEPRQATLLGGSGVARLAVGEGGDALDLELRGMGHHGSPRSRRQALRLAVGGRTVLGDLDDLPPRPDGWDRASASHNTVVVDGLNQRETPRMMREVAAGGDFLFFAADPDFQVAVLDDPRAYPKTTEEGGYRQTVVACSGAKARYAVSAFEVRGGSRHDQIFHAPAGRWLASIPTGPGPATLLPPAIPYVAPARAEDGRWFVQAYGEFGRITRGTAGGPTMAELHNPGRPGVRLHFLGDAPYQVVAALTPRAPSADDPARPALMIRRGSEAGADLDSTFVTVFEPTGAAPELAKVGRMTETPGFVVLYLETADGPEHLVLNLRPGTARTVQLADGRDLTTDGRVVRVRREALTLAGGTFAALPGTSIRQAEHAGKVLAAARFPTAEGRGWFETDAPVPEDPGLVGRTLLIRHGDGTTHGWTLGRVEVHEKRARLHVREEPGFVIEGKDRQARYYQFPRTTSPGPHTFRIATIRR